MFFPPPTLDPEHKAKNLKTLETIYFETFFNAKPRRKS
jgi:hypothetical protein